MADILSNNNKYSLKFTVTSGQESSLRTISGLNVYSGSGGGAASGPYADQAITRFLTNFVNFTDGGLGNVRWVTEQEVTF